MRTSLKLLDLTGSLASKKELQLASCRIMSIAFYFHHKVNRSISVWQHHRFSISGVMVLSVDGSVLFFSMITPTPNWVSGLEPAGYTVTIYTCPGVTHWCRTYLYRCFCPTDNDFRHAEQMLLPDCIDLSTMLSIRQVQFTYMNCLSLTLYILWW